MYCPSCGSEERQLSQFCRACGTDLRVVRSTLERPDAITASAISAREQIGMAVAEKIREMETSRDLKRVAEDVLPQFEKFLESPEEKRLRRIRTGTVLAAIGLAASTVFLLVALDKSDFFPFVAPPFVLFLLGLSFVINGYLYTVPRKKLPGSSLDAESQSVLDAARSELLSTPTTNLGAHGPAGSITEHTTHHLKSNQ